MEMISINIDVTKIDKRRLVKGAKGTYLEMVLIPTPNNKFDNDYMVVESVSKEEREAQVKGTILGNGKVIGRKTQNAPAPVANPIGDDDDVPF